MSQKAVLTADRSKAKIPTEASGVRKDHLRESFDGLKRRKDHKVKIQIFILKAPYSYRYGTLCNK